MKSSLYCFPVCSQEPGMALSEEDRTAVTRETNVVFHVAATVRFDEALSKSITINVRGTKELMDLAREMDGLESFVHVSTAYVHCHLQNEVIQEKGEDVPKLIVSLKYC